MQAQFRRRAKQRWPEAGLELLDELESNRLEVAGEAAGRVGNDVVTGMGDQRVEPHFPFVGVAPVERRTIDSRARRDRAEGASGSAMLDHQLQAGFVDPGGNLRGAAARTAVRSGSDLC